MRPRGSIRSAISSAVPMAGHGDVTWRDVAHSLHAQQLVNVAAPSELRMVRKTVENMRVAGELAPVGSRAVPGARRRMTTYARPHGNWATATTGDLGAVMRGWVG